MLGRIGTPGKNGNYLSRIKDEMNDTVKIVHIDEFLKNGSTL